MLGDISPYYIVDRSVLFSRNHSRKAFSTSLTLLIKERSHSCISAAVYLFFCVSLSSIVVSPPSASSLPHSLSHTASWSLAHAPPPPPQEEETSTSSSTSSSSCSSSSQHLSSFIRAITDRRHHRCSLHPFLCSFQCHLNLLLLRVDEPEKSVTSGCAKSP